MPLYLLAVPIVFIIRLLRLKVRFGQLISSRIGHFAEDTEIYLSKKDQEQEDYTDILYYQDTVCNKQLALMWERVIKVRWYAEFLDKVNRKVFGGKKHIAPIKQSDDMADHFRKPLKHISFTLDEIRKGEGMLDIILPQRRPFVCFIAREDRKSVV